MIRGNLFMKNILVALVILLAPLAGMAAGTGGGADRPLLIPGKQTLYQRVLSVPGARISRGPGVEAHAELVPFTALYVYARQEQGGKEWVEVGMDRFGSRAGWLPGTDCIEWNNGLTAAFRDPEGHDRVLLFKDSASLRQLAGQRDLQAYQRLYREAVQDKLPADSPVVAIQPPGFIDIQEDFYLVPIHRYEDIYLGARRRACCRCPAFP